MIEPPDEVEGIRPPGRIAPSIVPDAGEEREVRIRAPANRWSLRLANGDRGFLYSDDLVAALENSGQERSRRSTSLSARTDRCPSSRSREERPVG